jgi:hypothetical protein
MSLRRELVKGVDNFTRSGGHFSHQSQMSISIDWTFRLSGPNTPYMPLAARSGSRAAMIVG